MKTLIGNNDAHIPQQPAFKVGKSSITGNAWAVYAYRENAQVKMFDANNEAHANSVAEILNKALEALRGSTA